MNPVWHQVIRTGSVAADQQALATAQAHAAQQGLTLQVESLPQGGFQVVAYPPAAAMSPYAAAPVAQAAPMPVPVTVSSQCQLCGRHAPTKHVTFMQNIGMLVVRFPKTMRGHLCRTCIGRTFQSYTLTTLFLGWWGIISFFYSLVSIPQNIVQYMGARHLPVEFGPSPRG
jgi:hypothetical protein